MFLENLFEKLSELQKNIPNKFMPINGQFLFMQKRLQKEKKMINFQKVSPASTLPNYALDVFLVEIHKAKFALTSDLNLRCKNKVFLSVLYP